jgi:hypothetical protein
MIKERSSIKTKDAQKITKKKRRINLCKLGRNRGKKIPSSECKEAERRIRKDIGRFGIVKLRNNAEKIYLYIFTIYKTTNQIR